MCRLPMDSPKFNPTWTLEMPSENSQGASGASQPISEVLIKELSHLFFSPSTKFSSYVPECPPQLQDQKNIERFGEGIFYRKRHGVMTLLTSQKERIESMIKMIKYCYLNQFPQLQRGQLKEVRMLRLNQGWKSLNVDVIIACIIKIFYEATSIQNNYSIENNYNMDSI